MKLKEGGVTAPQGFSAAAARAGLRKSQRPDIALILSSADCACAAVFTSNELKAACIHVTARHLNRSGGKLRCVVVNSGNANALTGRQGIAAAEAMCTEAAKALKIRGELVAVASTGIIGIQLPLDKVIRGIREAAGKLSTSISAGSRAAEAILTTDTCRKEYAIETSLSDGRRITIGGMTKGSGMIAPRMKGLHATTLTFVTTDANIERNYLQRCLEEATEETYNMITVDGDMSTNDCIIVMANGLAGGPLIRHDEEFERALHKVMSELARMVAMDGEGETRLISVEIVNAKDREEARRAALAVAGSNLVKCAIFGGDPNVGRIASAIGASGVHVNFSRLDIDICGEPAVKGGLIDMDREKVAKLMKRREIEIVANLHAGRHAARALGSDLSYDYVRINSAYST